MATAVRAGHVPDGPSAVDPWLMELPWCSHTGPPVTGAGSIAASARSAAISAASLCGSQICTSFVRAGNPSKRSVSTLPCRCVVPPVAMSIVTVLPWSVPVLPVNRPSTSRS